jgi:hypothetical protein
MDPKGYFSRVISVIPPKGFAEFGAHSNAHTKRENTKAFKSTLGFEYITIIIILI